MGCMIKEYIQGVILARTGNEAVNDIWGVCTSVHDYDGDVKNWYNEQFDGLYLQ